MKPGLSTLGAIRLTGVAVTAAQPQVVVQDKLPAGAADAPRTTPSTEVLSDAVTTAATEAQRRQMDAEAAAKKEKGMAKDLADADVILRVPVCITGFDLSRMPKDSRKEEYRVESERYELRMECDISAVVTYGPNEPEGRVDSTLEVTLTPRIANGALEMIQGFGLPFRRWGPDATGFRDVTYRCRLGYGLAYTFREDLCLTNTTGVGSTCRVEGDVPVDF